jgi:hypothetical protein
MLNYSKLSKSQKAVIDIMRQGGELTFILPLCKFQLTNEQGLTLTMNNQTGNSLELGHYILKYMQANGKTFYKLNPDIK